VREEEIKLQIIKPVAKKGKKSFNGDLKIEPKIKPKQATITAVEIVIQNGPNVDLRYLCLISAKAKKKANFQLLSPSKTSINPFMCWAFLSINGKDRNFKINM
jgi:hypothetical protein